MSETNMLPPTHLDTEYLYKKYEPLRKSLYYKFRSRMASEADADDLASAIDEIFLALLDEYNPNRGVDFPYYIKKMMDLRVYHYVTSYTKNIIREIPTDEERIIEDLGYQELIDKLINLNSVDSEIVLGDKHRNLMIGILIEGKSLKELAEEEGVPSDRLHARLYFLIKKMTKEYEKQVEIYGKDMY